MSDMTIETTAGKAEERKGSKMGQIAWFLIVIAGWAVLAYIALQLPGGWTAAYEWVRGDNSILRIALQLVMWALLLPYWGALWLWHLAWPLWVRVASVASVFVWTMLVSVPQHL